MITADAEGRRGGDRRPGLGERDRLAHDEVGDGVGQPPTGGRRTGKGRHGEPRSSARHRHVAVRRGPARSTVTERAPGAVRPRGGHDEVAAATIEVNGTDAGQGVEIEVLEQGRAGGQVAVAGDWGSSSSPRTDGPTASTSRPVVDCWPRMTAPAASAP